MIHDPPESTGNQPDRSPALCIAKPETWLLSNWNLEEIFTFTKICKYAWWFLEPLRVRWGVVRKLTNNASECTLGTIPSKCWASRIHPKLGNLTILPISVQLGIGHAWLIIRFLTESYWQRTTLGTFGEAVVIRGKPSGTYRIRILTTDRTLTLLSIQPPFWQHDATPPIFM